MSKIQKIALLNLSIGIVGMILQLIHFVVPDLPIRLIASTITVILSCCLVVSYFHRRKLAKKGGIQYDERDNTIHKTAALTGCVVGFLVFFSATMITFLSVGPDGELKISSLLGIFLLSAMSFFLSESVTVLLQYHRQGNIGEEL